MSATNESAGRASSRETAPTEKRVANPRIVVRGEELSAVSVINRALHAYERLDDRAYNDARRWFDKLCDAYVEGFGGNRLAASRAPAEPHNEEPMSHFDKKVAVAACDRCGALAVIALDLIPPQDADIDDPAHDNRPAIASCRIVRDTHSDDHDACEGDIYYAGLLTLSQTLTARIVSGLGRAPAETSAPATNDHHHT